MKTNKFFQLLTLALCAVAFAFVTGCEGPAGADGAMGPNGTNGTNGEDGELVLDESCKVCHSETTLVLNAKNQEFDASAHSKGTYWDHDADMASYYGECAACHNNEGFLARADYTTMAPIYKFKGAKTQISCYTCHNIHTVYDATDWGLTFTDQVDSTLLGYTSPGIASVEFADYGNSNMCLQCHQSRDAGNVPADTATVDVAITSGRWGPHHGPQGQILQASGGVNIGSLAYPAVDAGHAGIENACINCHMYEGSHLLEVNLASCTPCHTEADAKSKMAVLKSDVEDDMLALGALLASQGVMVADLDDDGNTVYAVVSPNTITAVQAQAMWNYKMVLEDKSHGVHNPAYVKTLLENSIVEVTP